MENNHTAATTQQPTQFDFFRSSKGKLVKFLVTFLAFLVFSVGSLVIMGWFLYSGIEATVSSEALDRLITIRELKAEQVENYFHEIEQSLRLVSSLQSVSTTAQEFETTKDFQVPEEIKILLDGIRQNEEYDDILLVTPEGDIVYTVAKKEDLTTNLLNGPYNDSNLADLFKELRNEAYADEVKMADFAPYPPAGDTPVGFAGTAIASESKLVGILIYEIAIDSIDDLMIERVGLGATGEAYLVGPDLLMRSNSRFVEESSILEQKVDTPTVHKGLNGEKGGETIEDYRGIPTVSVYQPIEIGRLKWVLLVDIYEEELLAPARQSLTMLIMVISIMTVIMVFVGGGIAFFATM